MPKKNKNLIDSFINETQALCGWEIKEREPWNTEVTPDSIRHFAYGVGDDNPLYINKTYGSKSFYKNNITPPGYIISVLYPILHGANVDAPLYNIISEIEYNWYIPILDRDIITARSIQKEAYTSIDKNKNKNITIVSECIYWNQKGRIVSTAKGVLVKILQEKDKLFTDRKPYTYSDEELERIYDQYNEERNDTKNKIRDASKLDAGTDLNDFVRGPLTIGDMICWNAGAGPSYRGGGLGYFDLLKNPHNKTVNPITGWPVKYSQQHEDVVLASQRGMPAPFDNGVMRFSQIASGFRNMLHDQCFLSNLKIKIVAPIIYGDATWYAGRVHDKIQSDQHDITKIKFTGKNQIGELNTQGTAEFLFPKVNDKDLSLFYFINKRKKFHSIKRKGIGIHSLFEEQVKLNPDKTAVIEGDVDATYLDIEKLSNQIANYLLEIGTKKGEFIGIFLDRGYLNVACILGILKAGAVYVPLDSGYPKQRISEMLLALPLMAIITIENYENFFEKITSINTIIFQNISSIKHSKTDPPNIQISLEESACAIFTSGSIGTPKCVVQSHGSLVSYVNTLFKDLLKSTQHTYLHTANTSFSAATRQTFLPLCTGSTLVIAMEIQRHDPIEFFQLIKTKKVTILDTVPAVLREFFVFLKSIPENQKQELLSNKLQYLFSTGQAMQWKIPQLWHEDLKQYSQIVNLYSQTETAGTVCIYRVDKDNISRSGQVPIGRPLSDINIYLLDKNDKIVEDNDIGEIVVTGDRITEGYLNHANLTRDKFVSNTICDTSSIMYRTGDLARKTKKGDIIFSGRADDKIKVRGIGVDLIDIEQTLERITGVEQAVVVAKIDKKNAEYQIVGFVIKRTNSEITESSIKATLKDTLQQHMMPKRIQLVTEFPLGANGKIDKKQLKNNIKFSKREIKGEFKGTVIEKLCLLWEELLQVDKVLPDDDFFSLGGHSLKILELIVEVKKIFKQEISLEDVIEHNTVRTLSALLTVGPLPPTSQTVIKLKHGNNGAPLFCIPGIGGHLARHQLIEKYLGPEQAFYGFQAVEFNSNRENFRSVEKLAEFYINKMKEIQPTGPYFLIGTCYGGVIAYEMARQLLNLKEKVGLLVMVETRAPDLIISKKLLIAEQAYKHISLIKQRGLSLLNKITDNQIAVGIDGDKTKNLLVKKYHPNYELKTTLRKIRRQYRPKPYQGKVILYKVADSIYKKRILDRRRCWKRVARRGLQEFTIPGDHRTMFEEPFVQQLTSMLMNHKQAEEKNWRD